MFWLGFLCGILIYIVLIAVLTVVKYFQMKKKRKELLKDVNPNDLVKLEELLKKGKNDNEEN